MLNGKRCKVRIPQKPDWFGEIYSEPAMDQDGDWFVVVRNGNKLEAVDIYYIEIEN